MTENEAIEVCRQRATRRRVQLGFYVNSYFNDEELAAKVPQAKLPLGHWTVVFHGSGFDGEDFFIVNDSTGEVTWQTEPPSRWVVLLLYVVGYPVWLLTVALGFVIEPLLKAWNYYQLPRCPYCRGKLRTSSAQQCFTCGKAWHQPAKLGR